VSQGEGPLQVQEEAEEQVIRGLVEFLYSDVPAWLTVALACLAITYADWQKGRIDREASERVCERLDTPNHAITRTGDVQALTDESRRRHGRPRSTRRDGAPNADPVGVLRPSPRPRR
jgi:hypothetical protein